MWGKSNKEWERRKTYLIRSLFEDKPILSPIPETQESSFRSTFDSPIRAYSPLPDLIIEITPNKHDEPEEFYEQLEKKMKKIYKKMFIDSEDVSQISSTIELDRHSYQDDDLNNVKNGKESFPEYEGHNNENVADEQPRSFTTPSPAEESSLIEHSNSTESIMITYKNITFKADVHRGADVEDNLIANEAVELRSMTSSVSLDYVLEDDGQDRQEVKDLLNRECEAVEGRRDSDESTTTSETARFSNEQLSEDEQDLVEHNSADFAVNENSDTSTDNSNISGQHEQESSKSSTLQSQTFTEKNVNITSQTYTEHIKSLEAKSTNADSTESGTMVQDNITFRVDFHKDKDDDVIQQDYAVSEHTSDVSRYEESISETIPIDSKHINDSPDEVVNDDRRCVEENANQQSTESSTNNNECDEPEIIRRQQTASHSLRSFRDGISFNEEEFDLFDPKILEIQMEEHLTDSIIASSAIETEVASESPNQSLILPTSTPQKMRKLKEIEKIKEGKRLVQFDESHVSAKRRKFENIALQTSTLDVDWEYLKCNIFRGTPMIFNLCSCKNHTCD